MDRIFFYLFEKYPALNLENKIWLINYDRHNYIKKSYEVKLFSFDFLN